MLKRNKNKKKPNNSNLTQSILTTLRKQNSKPTNYKQVASILDVNDTTTRNLIIKILKKLQSEEKIEEISRGKYIIKASKNYYIGIADVTSRGQAYIIVDDLDDDIFITPTNSFLFRSIMCVTSPSCFPPFFLLKTYTSTVSPFKV